MLKSTLLLKGSKHFMMLEDSKKFMLNDNTYANNMLSTNIGTIYYTINDSINICLIVKINEGDSEATPEFSYITSVDKESGIPVCRVIYNNFKNNMDSANDMSLTRTNFIKLINEDDIVLYTMHISLHTCNLMHACEATVSIYSTAISEEESESIECDITINTVDGTITMNNNASNNKSEDNDNEEEEITYEKDDTDNEEEEFELIPINKAEEEHETSDNSIDNHEDHEEEFIDDNSDSTEDNINNEEEFVEI